MAVSGSRNARLLITGALALGYFGCAPSSSTPPPGVRPDASSTGGAPAGGSGGGGGTAGSGGVGSGTGGVSGAPGGSGGSGGSGGGGDIPDAAADLASSSDGGDVGIASGTRGVQSDPGTMGDGTSDQQAPFTATPETTMRIGGAPTGAVSGLDAPLIYSSKAVYAGLKFQYWIYVPAQYKPGKRAALMVLMDGHHYLSLPASSLAKFNAPITLDNLIHSGDIPVTIGLFINPGTADGSFTNPDDSGVRGMQYDTPSDRYSRFLVDEILPDLILSKYDIVEDPEGWSLVGHSSSGICAFMAGWYRPDKFRKLMTHNASFPNTQGMFPRLVREFATTKPLRINMVSSPLDLGRNADGGGQSSWFQGNNEAGQVLMMKGYHYRYRVGRGSSLPANPTPDELRRGDHYPPSQATADHPAALRWMWRGYKLPWYP